MDNVNQFVQHEAFAKQIEQLIAPDFIKHLYEYDEDTIWIYPSSVVRVLTILSNHHAFEFEQLVDITAVDYPSRPLRFEIVYHLLSLTHNKRLRVKVDLAEGGAIPSITPVFSNANWYEREVWDMFGIAFTEHPDLRRILTDYTFSGHPLRKDFPLTGYTQVRYCDVEKRVVYEPVQLAQDYRQFDFQSPWENAKIAKDLLRRQAERSAALDQAAQQTSDFPTKG